MCNKNIFQHFVLQFDPKSKFNDIFEFCALKLARNDVLHNYIGHLVRKVVSSTNTVGGHLGFVKTRLFQESLNVCPFLKSFLGSQSAIMPNYRFVYQFAVIVVLTNQLLA